MLIRLVFGFIFTRSYDTKRAYPGKSVVSLSMLIVVGFVEPVLLAEQ